MATATQSAVVSQHSLLPKVSTLKEGYLLKRQRGQSTNADLRKLKFQQRYVCLTQESLHYYVDQQKKGERGDFPVTRMKIIEKVPDATFQKSFCFQIGDEKEVMYFRAKSDNERKEWIETFRIAVAFTGNAMLQFYHMGAYGQVHQQRWSCCNSANRDSHGCQQITYQYGKQHTRAMSMVVESKSTSRGSPRPFASVRDHSKSKKREKETSSTTAPVDEESAEVAESLAAVSSPLSDFVQNRYSIASDKLMHQDSQNDSMEDVCDDTAAATSEPKVTATAHRSPSMDSGFDSGSKHGGSTFSIVSGLASPSPSIHHKLNTYTKAELPQKETILEQEPPKLGPTDCPPERKLSSSWKFQDLPGQPSQSEVVSALFRGVDKLITAQKNGSVQIANTQNLEERDSSMPNKTICDGDTVGSVDVWKNYLAVGSAELKVVNLDSGRALQRSSSQVMSHPYLVAFTPRGELLTFNHSQPNIIKVWPKVESLWSSSHTERERQLAVKDAATVETLSVSPNPSHPWLAINARELLQVYDYESQELKSRLNTSDEKTVVSFSPHGKYVAIACGRNLKLHDVESNTTISQFPEFDGLITSLAHNPWPGNIHLAVGLSNGEIQVYSDLLNSPRLLASLDNPEASTCLAYSKDGCTLAAVGSRGMTRLWKVPALSRSGLHQGVSLAREGELNVDSKGCQYVSADDGYAILFPSGAIPEGKTVTYKHGVVPDGPFGPFKFPKDVRPVSAIISLHPTTNQPLLKPIDISIPHVMRCEAWGGLAVLKADCHGDKENGRTIYKFREVANVDLALGMYHGDTNYRDGIPYAKFSTRHLCYWCIGTHEKEYTDRANFTLFEVKPKVVDQAEDLLIHFCLTYCLSTCHKTIREQYPEETHTLNSQSVVFSSGEEDSGIGINFEERLGSWHFSLQGGRDKQITQQDICFWDFPTPYYVKEMCDAKLYPPRFSVCIRGRPHDEVRADFKFTGAVAYPGRREPLSTVYLPLPAQRRSQSLSTGTGFCPEHLRDGLSLSRVTSDHSVASQTVFRTVTHLASPLSQQPLQHAAQAFKSCMCDLEDVHPSRLALTLIANDLIDDDTFESIQESMKTSTKDEMVLRTELLWKVYNALKIDTKLATPVQQALMKLNPDSAGKFASKISRLSRECSVTSSASLVTAPDTAPTNEVETPTAVDGQLQESNSDHSTNGPLSFPSESATFTSYSPIQFGDNLQQTISFSTQTSRTPTDPCSTQVTEPDSGEPPQAEGAANMPPSIDHT